MVPQRHPVAGGCTCTYTASFNTILIYLPDNCGLSAGTLTIVIPQAILTVNPAGEASASFSVGSGLLFLASMGGGVTL